MLMYHQNLAVVNIFRISVSSNIKPCAMEMCLTTITRENSFKHVPRKILVPCATKFCAIKIFIAGIEGYTRFFIAEI